MNIKVLVRGALLLGCLMSASAFAQTCSVRQVNGNQAVFFVPSGGDGRYNILGWGNGTGATVAGYDGLLRAAAARCVLVAAATTSNSGSGVEVQNAVNQARSRFSNILNANPRVCTSGHSQGGGGSFNAANRLGAQCVIAVQPDTVFTTRIFAPVGRNVDVTCIFSVADVLAPALPSNSLNCRLNSTIYREATTAGTHFAPLTGNGGGPGTAMRAAIDRLLR